MDDLNQQLRRHYDGQRLPADRVQEILAAGRIAAEAAKARRRWWRLAAAAIVVLGLGLFGASNYFRERTNRASPTQITATEIAHAVAAYFSDPNYQLPLVSSDRAALVAWLRQHGGPATFEVPPAMAGLTSYGCQVLQVQEQQVYLICFLLEPPPASAPDGAMPEKKMMVTVGPDGQMMKKSVPLVHLVVAPKHLFAETTKPGARVVLPAGGEWNFATWTQGEQVFVAAAMLPADRLSTLVRAL
jgi:hypothetical protein